MKQQRLSSILVLLEGQAAPGLPFLRQLHWIITPDPSSEKSRRTVDGRRRRRRHNPRRVMAVHCALSRPCRHDRSRQDFFFGRGRETGEVIGVACGGVRQASGSAWQFGRRQILACASRRARRALCGRPGLRPPAMPGAWPQAFDDSRRWCLLKLKPGTEPVRALVEPFIRTWQFDRHRPAPGDAPSRVD